MSGETLLIVSQQDPGHMTGGQGVVLRCIAVEASKILGVPVHWISMQLRGEPREQEYDEGRIRVHRMAMPDTVDITTPYQGDEEQQYHRRLEFRKVVAQKIRSDFSPRDTLVYLNGFYIEGIMAKDLPEYRSLSSYHLFLSRRLQRTGEHEPFAAMLRDLEIESFQSSKSIQVCSTGLGDEILAITPESIRAEIAAKIHVIPNGVTDFFVDTPPLADCKPGRIVAFGP